MSQRHLTTSELFNYANDKLRKTEKDVLDEHMNGCHLCFRRIRPHLKKAKERTVSPCSIFDKKGHSSTIIKCTGCHEKVCDKHVRTIAQFIAEHKDWNSAVTEASRQFRKGVICIDCELDIKIFDIEVLASILSSKITPKGKEFIATLIRNMTEPIRSKGV